MKKLFFGLTIKETLTTLLIPFLIALTTVLISGYFQMKTINKSSESQLEAAIKTADAQIKAAEISKVKEIEYDFKETNNWNVKESREYMPLNKGYYWMYSGTFTSQAYEHQEKDREKVFTKKVNFKFEIKKEIKNNGLSLFIVNNFPQDIYAEVYNKFLEMNEEELNSSQAIEFNDGELVAGLLLVANKLFYVSNDELDSVENYIKEPNKFMNQEPVNPIPPLSYDSLIFEFPLFKGQRFGDLSSITRNDLSNFWYVDDVYEYEKLSGENFEKTQNFYLIYNTLPDQQTLVFRPYIGILSIGSKHKGTISELILDLEEFKIQ